MKRPKLDWDNEQKAVKQNYNSLINTGIGLIAAIFIIIILVLKLNAFIAFLILAAIYGGATYGAYYYVKKNGQKLFHKMM